MFASIVEAGKLERALDLVERLHLEKSFEIAMKIADRHRKLVDFIENVKERKFGEEYEGDYDNFESPEDTEELGRSRISPDGNSARKRQFENDDDRNVRLKQSTYA